MSDPVPVLRPPRVLTDETLPEFEQTLAPYLQGEGPGIVLDLLRVEFVSSSGLSGLVRLGMDLGEAQRRLALARPQRDVERLIIQIGLSSMLRMFKTVDDATAHISTTGT